MTKSSKTKYDIEFMIDKLIISAGKKGNEKCINALMIMKSNLEIIKNEDVEVIEEAQRDYRSTIYAAIKWCRITVNSMKTPVENIVKTLSVSAIAILWVIAEHTTDEYIQISKSQIGELCGLTVKTVAKSLKELNDCKILEIVSKKSGKAAAVYRWNPIFLQVGKPRESFEEEIDKIELNYVSDLVEATAKDKKIADLFKANPTYITARKKLPVKDSERMICFLHSVPSKEEK